MHSRWVGSERLQEGDIVMVVNGRLFLVGSGGALWRLPLWTRLWWAVREVWR